MGGDTTLGTVASRGSQARNVPRRRTGPGHQRAVRGTITALVAGLLGYAYYTQYVEYLDPCPLCITQRAFYLIAGVAALVGIAGIRRIQWQKATAAVIVLGSLGGLGTAARQVWLQHLPPEKVPECGPGLQYWLENMPLLQTVKLLFKGDGNCAEVDWTFLGLSMAGWSIVMFSLLLGAGVWLYLCRSRLESSVPIRKDEYAGRAAVAVVRS